MGIISILLGIVTFICFTGGGAIIATKVKDLKVEYTANIVSLETVSNTGLVAVIIAVFAFIGLLIGMNLIMHGVNYRKNRPGRSSLSVISSLLGVIALCCFTMVGVYISNTFVPYKELLASFPQMSALSTTPDLVIYGVIIGIFAFIGLLICINLVMHGLTNRKIAKLQGQLRRR